MHADYDGGVIELPRRARGWIRRRCRSSPPSAATTSSPPAATRCSAPTTRPGWPRSWRRSPTSPPIRSFPGPPLRICFTPDEEIGEGATLFDIDRFGAVVRLHHRRLRDRRGPGRDVRRLRGRRHHPRRRRPPRARDRQARQRAAARRRDRRPPALGAADAGHDLRAGGLHPPLRADGDCRRGADPRDRPGLRRGPARPAPGAV